MMRRWSRLHLVRELVITTDAIVAGVHFFPDDAPETIGHKALGVNLSDLAAKGADPFGFVLSFVMPRKTDDAWISCFAGGLGLLAAANSPVRFLAAIPWSRPGL